MKINEAKHGLNEARGLIYNLILLYIRHFSIYKIKEFKEKVFCKCIQENFTFYEQFLELMKIPFGLTFYFKFSSPFFFFFFPFRNYFSQFDLQYIYRNEKN